MADAATLSVLLKSRGLDSATRDLKNMRGEIAQAGGGAQKAGANFKAMALQITAVAATATAIGVVGIKLINAASAAEEMRNKFDATFGGATPRARAELALFSLEVGRGNIELQRMASDVGAVLKSAGLMESQAADLSVELTKLATDVASFTNANDADVLQAFTRALTGEREALKTYGISILEAEVKAKGLALGMELVAGQLSSTDKALATYQLLLDKTNDSQGDAAKTSESYANQTRALKGQMADFAALLGSVLIPAATKSASFLSDLALVINDVSDAATNAQGPVEGLGVSFSTIVPGTTLFSSFRDKIGEIAEESRDATQAALEVDIAFSQWQEDMGIWAQGMKSQAAALETSTEGLNNYGITAKQVDEIQRANAKTQFLLGEAIEKKAAKEKEATRIALEHARALEFAEASLSDWAFANNTAANAISKAGLSNIEIIKGLADIMDVSTESIIKDLAAQGLSWKNLQDITSKYGDQINELANSLAHLGESGKDSTQNTGPSAVEMQRTTLQNTIQGISDHIGRQQTLAANATTPEGRQRHLDIIQELLANQQKLQKELEGLRGLANGGTITRGGMVRVGERGPEILSLPTAAQVTPLSRAGGMGGGTSVTWIQNAPIYGFMDAQREITEMIVKAKKAGHPGL